MAGYLGKIREFDSTSESYVERLEHFFSANKVGDDQKKDALLECVGKETFGLLRALVAPTRLKDKTFGELVETLRIHLSPKSLVVAERFRFYKRDQKETRLTPPACKSWLSTATLGTRSRTLQEIDWFQWERCRFCKLQGHAERVCRKKMKAESMREASWIKELKGDSRSDTEDSTDGEALHGMEVSFGNPLKQWKAHKPMYVQVIMEGQPIKMELDTGAALSIMPYTMYKEKMSHIQLQKSTVNLKTYTGQRVRPLGEITVQVAKNGTVERLKLVVVDGLGPPLMGRNWLSRIPIDWGEIKVLRAGDEKQSRTLRLKRLLETYPGIQKEQGTLKGTKAHLPLKGNPSVPKGQTSTLQFADKSGEGRGGNYCTGCLPVMGYPCGGCT
eukprot:Em0019g1072a